MNKHTIEQWKKEHGEIFKLIPNPETPDCFAIVRKPKIADIVLSSVEGGTDRVQTGISQLNSCWLGGDERIKINREYLESAAKQMACIFKVFRATIEYVTATDAQLAEMTTEAAARVKASDLDMRKITVYVPGEGLDKDGQPLPDEEISAYIHKPHEKDMEAANTATNPVDRGIIFLQECWIMGDERFKTGSDEIRFAAYLQALKAFRIFACEVVKL